MATLAIEIALVDRHGEFEADPGGVASRHRAAVQQIVVKHDRLTGAQSGP